MKRLLCILSSMNAGGAETFLMKIYRNIDRFRYQMDFCINVREKCFYEDEILSMGGKIYCIPSKTENLREFKKQLTRVVSDNGYTHVLRITSSGMGLMDLKIAKRAGATVCCARSSNASDGDSLKAKLMHRVGRLLYQKYVDIAIAPSDLAAIYTFGKKAYRSGDVHMLHNAVDLRVFRFDEVARAAIRKEFGIGDGTLVLGHVGRFFEQKNHTFLADIFKAACDRHPDTVLLLVGDGPLKGAFAEKIRALGLSERVIFAGVRSDVPALLSAMDAFVFPSFYEGMPNTVIEAQATGLPCFISDTITREADITGLVEYLPLEAGAVAWGEKAVSKWGVPRQDTREAFALHGYDVASAASAFTRLIWADNDI